ncbi:CPBP family intramembrane glutamic endopeptidase [Ichthyenterobacterium sp. W332]|uniref:CPBP family intramembrane glutamic endopeptidase n=1 Tax=Microcosmobacter mediterraneus TaxID=3075607 RepID=A0ABU2YL16_9FLAO|nr:CPBP family intramembrane glutamic endopeptidase [Ichthyenterobacterium sp. W332]MDT0558747.1 CPBP family intramembrane glutamic endopeptidase [Ichthyenterobacterium sp. W332]
MKTAQYRLTELFILFVLVPISLVIDISILVQIGISILAFLYVMFILIGVETVKIHIKKNIDWKRFWKYTFIKFLVIAIITYIYVLIAKPEHLFKPVKDDYRVWLLFLCIYTFMSVYIQELIYRTFFFKRYKHLFKSENLFILVNAALFSLAHIFFKNAIVMVITFVGGLLFALTFKNTKSTLLVFIEHALYGCWLYTVGMGDMLGFPS